MLLRTRITLMVTLSTLVLAGVLLVEGRVREQRATHQYEQTLVAGDRNAWSGAQQSETERLNTLAEEILQDDRITRAVAAGDRAGLGASMGEIVRRMQTGRVPAQVEIIAPDGSLQFAASGQKTTDLPAGLIADATRRGTAARGLARNRTSSELMVTVMAPFYARTGVSGVLAIHSPAAALLGDVASAVGASVFLGGPDGKIVASPDLKPTDPAWKAAAGLQEASPDGVLNRAQARQVFLLDWFELGGISGASVGRLTAVRDVSTTYRHAALVSVITRGAMLSGGALFLAFLYWYLRNAFVPLNAVIRVLNALSHGNTAAPKVEVAGRNDEIGRLAGTLEDFRQAQKARDQLLRIRQDIDAASRIQQSILPRDFPVAERYRLHAIMRPAQNVGGDFYDFFELSGGRLGVVVADVSGKGMAAAIFMAMARTVIRSVAVVVDGPGECLTRANDLLCASNTDSTTFVTVFYGILDPATGRVVYANGGHNPPYRVHADGGVDEVPGVGGLVLGVMEKIRYADGEVTLAAGDRLVLFTDGVTEAMNAAGDQFTEERLTETLAAMERGGAQPAVEAVLRAVDEFAGEAAQADDITCLVIAMAPGLTA